MLPLMYIGIIISRPSSTLIPWEEHLVLKVSTKIISIEAYRVDSPDFMNEVKVRIGRDDLFYSVVDHGGGMDSITGCDSINPF